ncbi:DNA-3-methyladenine glycosylase [Candidatus Berkelbacteria bacterium RIFCSPLOWO2_01_FULL_50_28]|uniref:DNA-3-methyladenine glycosylase n=1 Tax=Candidatus Berkelbacteria bacterium RIFCSPLOWO2_01_FULL_50_28 TaxID=1797471 RepID=A0A1F5EAN4_9BACT|nr:MAG: DNA-3-methyladenine glycosylase [Candidatus Berkelbacteria bacterium RIFCSPHIGHO2_01_FULL_50_36]OGD62821.1 MAG: DNA-3-methyladenine glycosylase [Candidatus Berkelbacteria bacterium RIFCSPHIGHO2_12_FULL_50_11]OGD64477.1 MAG: DNA-3-methyladenine glycosylase [Candidatus Berkelbacteria bacterium RIFCSPLOWO2_01_FULL_50_28]
MATGRCSWPGTNPLMVKYHDEEWGVPCHDDRKLFEYIVLDTFQAGLSWAIVLNKRENFRKAFDNFDPNKIANYGFKPVQELESDAGIIRNKLKIRATVTNAQAFLAVQKEFGSFDKYIWGFVNGKPIVNHHQKDSDIGATSPQSDEMSIDLKRRGFKFVGSTICYAFMQGAGLVNDHIINCFRHEAVIQGKK